MPKLKTTKKEYNVLVSDGNRGHFPRWLSIVDGNLSQEFADQTVIWEGDLIAKIDHSDDWPVYKYIQGLIDAKSIGSV
jgi:uncharacterized protein YcsI (UPF0317 family)